ncbi:glycosyl transferase [Companilactobacillus sp. RD055328]|uniref:glycosyltransferase family 2 protein n=1 Tax=Companilactobacillus sp. RD055328 TaxID=2916634 RepID=UPI001FC822FD|nr:glycosyltransferase family A protein [Companilactobacillus sp. RD055328]GKQ43252.1 glycosyl transferase [Companilactobacillus sp. RD055328]
MDNKYKITVVIPVFNAADYLEKALSSFERQTFKDFQLILVDDKSSDNSVEICERYIENNKNFKLVKHTTNQGVSAARNTGIKLANSELITFADCDDWVEANYLEYFVDTFNKYDLDLSACGFMIETEKSSKPKGLIKESGKLIKRNEMLQRIISVNGTVMGYTWNKAYKLDVIRNNELTFATDVGLMEDAIFNVQYTSATDRFYFSSDPLYHYVQRKNSASHAYFDLNNIKDVGVANFRIHKQIIQNIGDQIDPEIKDVDDEK